MLTSRHNKEFVYKNRWTNSVKFQAARAGDGTGGRLKIWFEARIGLGRHKATSLEHVEYGDDWEEPDSMFQLSDPIYGTNPLNEKIQVESLIDNLVKINETWEDFVEDYAEIFPGRSEDPLQNIILHLKMH